MKLVELLAEKIKEWPEGAKNITQDHDGSVSPCTDPHNDLEFDGSRWSSTNGFHMGLDIIGKQDLSSDYKTAIVTRAQWQAERDKQKGGEWKRHRGGKCPVPVGTKVSTRHRDGEVVDVHFHTATTGSGPATMNAIWKHTGDGHDIMAYKIISQPQAEEVEVDKFCMGENCNATAESIAHSHECEAEHEASYNGAWDQIETPFKWRDEVTELNAYIEKYTRERDALIERLASEGFALIPPIVSVVSEFSGAQQIIPFEEWTDGDIVRCIDTGLSCADLTLGNEYTVVTRHGETGVIDDEGDHMCSCIDVGELEFVRRP